MSSAQSLCKKLYLQANTAVSFKQKNYQDNSETLEYEMINSIIDKNQFSVRNTVIRGVLDTSLAAIGTENDCSHVQIAEAFRILEKYVINLLKYPSRLEFRTVKLYSGFWLYKVAGPIPRAVEILNCMGYIEKEGRNELQLEGAIDRSQLVQIGIDMLVAIATCNRWPTCKEDIKKIDQNCRADEDEFSKTSCGTVLEESKDSIESLLLEELDKRVKNIDLHGTNTEQNFTSKERGLKEYTKEGNKSANSGFAESKEISKTLDLPVKKGRAKPPALQNDMSSQGKGDSDAGGFFKSPQLLKGLDEKQFPTELHRSYNKKSLRGSPGAGVRNSNPCVLSTSVSSSVQNGHTQYENPPAGIALNGRDAEEPVYLGKDNQPKGKIVTQGKASGTSNNKAKISNQLLLQKEQKDVRRQEMDKRGSAASRRSEPYSTRNLAGNKECTRGISGRRRSHNP